MKTHALLVLATAFVALSPSARSQDLATVRVTGTIDLVSAPMQGPNFPNAAVGDPVELIYTVVPDTTQLAGPYTYVQTGMVSLRIGGTTLNDSVLPAGANDVRVDNGVVSDRCDGSVELQSGITVGFDIYGATGAVAAGPLRESGPFTLAATQASSFISIFESSPFQGDISVSFATATVSIDTPIGYEHCVSIAQPNSTGQSGYLTARGSTVAADNNVTFRARNLPPSQFGFMLVSDQIAGSSLPVGDGLLCLGGAIGRYDGPGEIVAASDAGEVLLNLDLTQIPIPTGIQSVAAGDTWCFQFWHRDINASGQTSNLTSALEVIFR